MFIKIRRRLEEARRKKYVQVVKKKEWTRMDPRKVFWRGGWKSKVKKLGLRLFRIKKPTKQSKRVTGVKKLRLKSKSVKCVRQKRRLAFANRFVLKGKQDGHKALGFWKQRNNVFDKLFYYYKAQLFFTFFTYKVLCYFEMFVSTFLSTMRLVKHSFQVPLLCLYNLVAINGSICTNTQNLITIFDTVSVHTRVSFYLFYQQHQQNFFARRVQTFFQLYNRRYTSFRSNKIWLLHNAIKNTIPECVVFEQPSVLLYLAPFRRAASLFFQPSVRDFKVKNSSYFSRPRKDVQQAILKSKLFEYAAFYK